MRNRHLLMLIGGALVASGPLAGAAFAAPDPPQRPKTPPPPPSSWWSHTNQDRFVPINDPSHTNQDGLKPPKDPPPKQPTGEAGGGDRGPIRWFEPSDLEVPAAVPAVPGPAVRLDPGPDRTLPRLDPGPAGSILAVPSDGLGGAGAFGTGPGALAPIPGPAVLPLLALAALGGRRRRR